MRKLNSNSRTDTSKEIRRLVPDMVPAKRSEGSQSGNSNYFLFLKPMISNSVSHAQNSNVAPVRALSWAQTISLLAGNPNVLGSFRPESVGRLSKV